MGCVVLLVVLLVLVITEGILCGRVLVLTGMVGIGQIRGIITGH